MTLQEIIAIITVVLALLSFFGGIATFIFKKIMIDPLKGAINSLDVTIQKLEKSTNKQLDIHDKEIEFLKLKTTRHDEQLKTLFGKRESV
jgi:hypothetical protein